MDTSHESVTGHGQLLSWGYIEQSSIITNTQRHTGLAGEVGEIASDQFKFAGLMAMVRQVKSSLSSYCFIYAVALQKYILNALISSHFNTALGNSNTIENTVNIFKRICRTESFRQINAFVNHNLIRHIDTVEHLIS